MTVTESLDIMIMIMIMIIMIIIIIICTCQTNLFDETWYTAVTSQ